MFSFFKKTIKKEKPEFKKINIIENSFTRISIRFKDCEFSNEDKLSFIKEELYHCFNLGKMIGEYKSQQ